MPYRHGLVVGKFSPLHRGHEWLIDTALEQCAAVTVISYSKPEFASCERVLRERWLVRRFPSAKIVALDDLELARRGAERGVLDVAPIPDNDASDEEQRAFVAWVCERLLGHAVDAVFTSEAYGDGFASALDAHFRATGTSSCGVAHVCVDQARARFPVSGTAVREDPEAYRDLVSEHVRKTFVRRVCVLGGESSGKTTLAQALAGHLDTQWVPEYGRELWEARGGELRYDDFLAIAEEQVEREARGAAAARDWLVADTSPLTTLFYSLELFGAADRRLVALADRRYDRVLLCAPDFEFVQDGTRRDAGFRAHGHHWYERELARRKVPYRILTGSLGERLASASAYLQSRETAMEYGRVEQ